VSAANESRSQRLLQVLAFAAVYLIWGSTYLAIRVAVATLPPFLMAGVRFLSAGLVLYGVLRLRGVRAPSLAEWRHAAVAGVLMLSLGNGLVSWAEQSVASNQAALLIAGVPLYVALLEWWMPNGRRPARLLLVGIGLGFAGMLLLVMQNEVAGTDPVGIGILVLAGLAWAIGTLYARHGKHHPHALMSAAAQMLAGGWFLLVFAFLRGDAALFAVSALSLQSGLALAYLTVFGSLIAFSAYGWLVVVSTPSRLSTAAYVNPLIAVILGWLVLGESLTPRAMLGGVLILGAVVLMTLGSRRRPRALQPEEAPAEASRVEERGGDSAPANA
jgi:drug/metabolite transporter (DMT)-like permease